MFIVANDIYTRESEFKASALTHLSRIWLITAACLMHPMRMKKNVHRIIGYGCSLNLHKAMSIQCQDKGLFSMSKSFI